ncbi:hypothetical protein [Protaetiibacter larvae]|uniref:LPXTG cell wall anchor domain-containing protein n=1 Tax=Protaetiibacter larvae TaxID=2592654 RepID=A0A5C1YBL8_9MICO|nr:hypothetical protein [Protaetiibacter larvae]QEO10529.1 hypothetical protein FLP23_11275 [Protaetiibacter larvae]
MAMAAVGVLAGAAAPAQAATVTGVQFSHDGLSWTSTVPSGLFDDGFVFVPGDSRSATFRIRNAQTTGIRVAVVLSNAGWSNSATGGSFTLRGADQNGLGLSSTPFSSIPLCTPIVPTRILFPGEELVVTSTVRLSPAATGPAAQNGSVQFVYALAFSEAAAPAIAPSCAAGGGVIPPDPGVVVVIPSGPTPPSVPATSSPQRGDALGATGVGRALVPTLIVSIVAAAIGSAFVVIARRRRTDEEQDEPVAPVMDEALAERLTS